MDTSKMIKAYCLKTKEKNVPMQDAVITKTAKGGYMASGHDGKGNKMAAIMSILEIPSLENWNIWLFTIQR